jgi:hypothetical protein
MQLCVAHRLDHSNAANWTGPPGGEAQTTTYHCQVLQHLADGNAAFLQVAATTAFVRLPLRAAQRREDPNAIFFRSGNSIAFTTCIVFTAGLVFLTGLVDDRAAALPCKLQSQLNLCFGFDQRSHGWANALEKDSLKLQNSRTGPCD